jgi:hypothetical protein
MRNYRFLMASLWRSASSAEMQEHRYGLPDEEQEKMPLEGADSGSCFGGPWAFSARAAHPGCRFLR